MELSRSAHRQQTAVISNMYEVVYAHATSSVLPDHMQPHVLPPLCIPEN